MGIRHAHGGLDNNGAISDIENLFFLQQQQLYRSLIEGGVGVGGVCPGFKVLNE